MLYWSLSHSISLFPLTHPHRLSFKIEHPNAFIDSLLTFFQYPLVLTHQWYTFDSSSTFFKKIHCFGMQSHSISSVSLTFVVLDFVAFHISLFPLTHPHRLSFNFQNWTPQCFHWLLVNYLSISSCFDSSKIYRGLFFHFL